MSENQGPAEHMFFEGITPATIEGAEPGSTYKLVARTIKGYIAARRLSDNAYRIRVERFDKQPMIEVSMKTAKMLASLRMYFSAGGARVSGVVIGTHAFRRAASFLLSILLENDLKLDDLPIQLDPGVVKHEAHVKTCVGCSKFYGLPLPEGAPQDADATDVNGNEHEEIQAVLAITDGKTN